MTTTTHPSQLTTSVVAPDARVDVDVIPRIAAPATRWPLTLLAADLAAAAVASVVVQATAGVGAPAVAAAVPVLWLALVVSTGGYRQLPGEVRTIRARALARAGCGLGLALGIPAAVAPEQLGDSAVLTARAGLALAVLVPVSSMTVRRLLGSATAARRATRIVIAGEPRGVDEVLREVRRAASAGTTTFEPVAVCLSAEHDEPPATLGILPVWRGLEFVADAVHAHAPDAVVVAPCPELDPEALRRLSARLQETRTALVVSSGLRDVAGGRVDLATAGGLRALHVRPAAASGPARFLKDAVDRLGAAVLLALLAPVLAMLVVAIRLDSTGPALFRQVRVGRHGEQFTLWKLRTMSCDAEDVLAQLREANEHDDAGLLFKIRRDPRITRVGAVLRKYSLDELPQLVNVLRGEMSLVGPRPALPAEVRAYSAELRRRLVVKPGMTGLWQVSGRSDLPWEETVRLDLAYVDNWSWSLDGSIIARTAGAVVGHRGAY